MKIIDLLNKIANGEEEPYRIKYNERIYEYAEEIKWYLRDDMKCELSNSKKCLNDIVEILEEKKTKPLTKKNIEALGYACGEIQKCFTNGWTKSLENKPLEEEKKIPEKLEDFDIQGLEVSGYSMSQAEYLLEDGVKENREMINWILDYLKSKGDE